MADEESITEPFAMALSIEAPGNVGIDVSIVVAVSVKPVDDPL